MARGMILGLQSISRTTAMGSKREKPDKGIEALHLKTLEAGTPGITSAFGESLAQAASVCLEDQEHRNGTEMLVDGDFEISFYLFWDEASDQTRRCWANPEVATEHGAYGIATLLVLNLTELTIVERSRRGTGFDYWLGPKANPKPLFQGKARLEVSGIRKGTDVAIRSRAREKLKQTERSNGMLPTMVIVVEFGAPRSRVLKR